MAASLAVAQLCSSEKILIAPGASRLTVREPGLLLLGASVEATGRAYGLTVIDG